MKIVQVTNSYKPAWQTGGVCRVAYDITSEFLKRGHDVSVLTTNLGAEHNVIPNKWMNVDGANTIYGIVVKPGDVESIRSAILHLKENAPAREAMGRNGRAYLERNMSLEKNVALYEEIFHALAGDGVRARRPVSSRSEDALGGLDSHGT